MVVVAMKTLETKTATVETIIRKVVDTLMTYSIFIVNLMGFRVI